VKAVHEKLKPYNCEQCDQTFAAKAALGFHIAEVHDKTAKRYECEDCDYKTVRPGNFKRHKKSCV
ncbi:MAG: hypothetical protein H0X02_07530, partial [Nitrosomonas sp.]|nr:hypothetical protein [Nitrosomonas sp.]